MVYKGRSIPLFWAVMQPTLPNKNVNAFEYGFLTLLSQLLPKGAKAILLFDRGFHRVELCRFLERLGFHYVIRSGGTTWTSHPRYEGYMGNCTRRKGKIIDLPRALLRKERPIISRVVDVWATNQKEAWILVTNLDDNAATVIRWYGRRFQIEEMFRDQKSHRFGLGLGQLKMFDPDRLERLLLIVVFAHFLAMAVGAFARAQGKDRSFAANSGKNITQFSDFYLGKFYIWRLPWPPMRTISLFIQCSEKLRG